MGQASSRRRGDRRRHRQARPASHHGRRADLRVDRRHGRRGMEHPGAGAGEATQGGRAVPQARRPLCLGAPAAFRPGQVVSRRAAAALVAQLPLAQGRRGDLARPAPLCPGGQADGRHAGDGASLCARLRPPPAARSRLPLRRLRGHLVLPVARAAPAQQRHGRRSQDEGRDGARAPGAGVRSRTRGCCRYRAADPARAQRPRPLAQRAVVPAFGEVLPDPGRFAARLPPAARFPAVGDGAGHRLHRRPRPDGAASGTAAARCLAPRPGAAPPGTRLATRHAGGHERRRRHPPRGLAAGAGAGSRPAARRRPLGRQHRAHRDLLRVARRPSLRLHAADRAHRGLSRPRHRDRGHRRGAPPAGVHRRLSAARFRSAPAELQRHARSRRHRGQHPSVDELARARRPRPRSSTRKRAPRGWAPRNS